MKSCNDMILIWKKWYRAFKRDLSIYCNSPVLLKMNISIMTLKKELGVLHSVTVCDTQKYELICAALTTCTHFFGQWPWDRSLLFVEDTLKSSRHLIFCIAERSWIFLLCIVAEINHNNLYPININVRNVLHNVAWQ